ncbi:hypothetical protein [Photobacterium sanctipauli]|nr:hypothetical protein [Photobacterium sanctipauli]
MATSKQTSKATESIRDERQQPMSMHEGIAPWCDCCVCEAEPYWAEVAEEMGISLSDYEEADK